MGQVLCAVDGSPAAQEAVERALALCREHGAGLRLVGLVKQSWLDPPQPSCGEQVRRYQRVQFGLVRAAEAARAAGLTPEVALRAGDPAKELLAEADAAGAAQIFLGRGRSRIAAALTGRPRVGVAQIQIDEVPRPEAEEAIRRAA